MIGITEQIGEPTVALAVAVGLHLTARLAYVLQIGMALRAAGRAPVAPPEEAHARWLRFRRRAALILNADAVTTALIIAASLDTFPASGDLWWLRVAGAMLVVIGIAVKASAYRAIGEKGYYWYNFFSDDAGRSYVARGIYRHLDNPMYGPGYLHAIGFPLLFLSFWGVVSALVDWLAVWIFYFAFERPHTLRHAGRVRSDRVTGRHASYGA